MPQKVVITHRHAMLERQERDATGIGAFSTNVKLSERKLKQFRVALSQPQFAAYESPLPGNCADCYVYTISFRGHTISFPQSEIPVWIRKTVGRFEALVENHLPRH
jgi:hypothetical protein